MGAGQIILANKGPQDIYLTASPEINQFSTVNTYKRYINFATELVEVYFNDLFDFGKSISCDIPNKGHLISKMYLKVTLPALTQNQNGGTYLSWCDTVGYALFDGKITLEINGVDFDYMYPDFNSVYESFTNMDLDIGNNLAVLRSDTFVSGRYNALSENELMIPLDFWFTRDYSKALPVYLLDTTNIKVRLKVKEFGQLVNYDGAIPIGNVSISDTTLFVEYVYLDDSILTLMSKSQITKPIKYLVDQVSFNGAEIVPSNTQVWTIPLDFNNPVKELVFALATTESISNNDYYNFGVSTDNNGGTLTAHEPILESFQLVVDGHNLMNNFIQESYSRLAYPRSLGSYTPLKYIYNIPFCTGINKPSGSMNMSLFDNVTLSIKLQNGNPESFLYMYAVSYNVITILNGTISLEFMR